jgi:hypothetical protein
MKKRVSLTKAFTFGMAVLSLPTLALAQAISVELQSPGELTGAGVVVPVTVACVDNSTGADLEVHLTQGNAQGEGDLPLEGSSGEVKCGSTPQTVHVLVRSFSSSFGLGSGDAHADLDACDSTHNNCNFLSSGLNRTIRIVQ